MNIHQSRRVENAVILCYEVNRAWCDLHGDASFVPYTDAPQWQKDTNRAGVEMILEHPDTTPEESHESWMEKKIADGWVYGDVKDPEKKTHPCIQPYSALPLADRMKDHLFGGVARGALAAYAPRTAFADRHTFKDTSVGWRCTNPAFTFGMYVICGRMGIVFDSALRAYDRASGHPVPSKSDALNRFAEMTNLCMTVVDEVIGGKQPGERAFEAWRMSEWPTIAPPKDDRATAAWEICYRIVRTIMEIEGVTTIPRHQRWIRTAHTTTTTTQPVFTSWTEVE